MANLSQTDKHDPYVHTGQPNPEQTGSDQTRQQSGQQFPPNKEGQNKDVQLWQQFPPKRMFRTRMFRTGISKTGRRPERDRHNLDTASFPVGGGAISVAAIFCGWQMCGVNEFFD